MFAQSAKLEAKALKALELGIQTRRVEQFVEAMDSLNQAEEVLLTAPKKLPKVLFQSWKMPSWKRRKIYRQRGRRSGAKYRQLRF